MNLSAIGAAFNRALFYTCSKTKLLLVYVVILACGLLTVFFRGLAAQAGSWTLLSLTFLPLFFSVGLLLSMGILLVRIYHDEVKQKPVDYWSTAIKSWDTIAGAAYFFIPILLGYLALWIIFAIYMLLKAVPGIGEFVGVILAFVPFVLHLSILALVVISWTILFFVSPLIALRSMDKVRMVGGLLHRIRNDPFSNLILAALGLVPMAIFGAFAFLALYLTESVCFSCLGPMERVLENFFILIPFAAILTLPTIFFFNFAAEAHILLQKNQQD
jgi:hypothetical protein